MGIEHDTLSNPTRDSKQSSHASEKQDRIGQLLVSYSLQFPTTIFPLFVAALGVVLLIIDLPLIPTRGLIAVTVISVLASLTSFCIDYFRNYDSRSTQLLDDILKTDEEAKWVLLCDKTRETSEELQAGFTAKGSEEGYATLRRMAEEFEQIAEMVETWPDSGLVSTTQIRQLSGKAYLEGLNLLTGLLQTLPNSPTSSSHIPTEEEIEALERRIEKLTEEGGDQIALDILISRLSLLKERRESSANQELQTHDLLRRASLVENALNRTRIGLAALRAENDSHAQEVAVDALRREMDRTRQVLEEMKKLGF